MLAKKVSVAHNDANGPDLRFGSNRFLRMRRPNRTAFNYGRRYGRTVLSMSCQQIVKSLCRLCQSDPAPSHWPAPRMLAVLMGRDTCQKSYYRMKFNSLDEPVNLAENGQ